MRKTIAFLIAAIATAAAAFAVAAPRVDATDPIVQQYWACFKLSDATENRGKGDTAFPSDMLASCAQTSDAVQRKYFKGDFAKLHAWTQAQRKVK